MDTVNLAIGAVGLIVTMVTSYLLYRKSVGARGERIQRARTEIINILVSEFANSVPDVDLPVVEALLNNKYRNCGIDSLTVTELPIIIDDLITNLTQNAFISSEKRKELVQKTLRLKKDFENRKSNLEEAIASWRRSSIFLISIGIALTVSVGIFSGLVAIVAGARLFPTTIVNINQLLWVIGFAAALFGFYQYRILKSKRDRSSHYLQKVLEENAIEALRRSVQNSIVEKYARIEANKHLVTVDLIVTQNGIRLPVEIKHSFIRNFTIEQIVNAMNSINAKKGLLITSSAVSKKVKELARQNSVIILDKVTSEADIVEGLNNTKLFE